ncbi:hypothetical protein SAMN05421493_10279 [Pseudobutyrivibrio sp. 49]|uniref:hypothetical protein n=1 Tax=Pseudobutyrivibrio sp. 49 TaxID=1855344 RepID=UPI00088E3B62|nr:hypothetical protein [Pseudobutyrivibrio sp. 49]SDH59686.1 hypothetical protein SAMN05421493_10279 [Pseudobutyrivibrio sp. 49]
MKDFLKYILIVIVSTAFVFWGVIFAIIVFPRGRFYTSYQNVIVDKYRILQKTEEPKIVVVSGSSSSFGLDQKMLEEESGYKVVNLGLHAGFGHLFYSELSKENINKGDIVLLGYEYGWENGFDSLGQDLIMTGIDDNIDMYKHIPPSHWKDFIGYLFKFAEIKNNYPIQSGIYSREAFDSKTAQMIMDRQYEMDYMNNIDLYGQIDITNAQISESAIDYLKDYKEFVERKGANVYFISPPLLKQAIICDYSEFESLKQQEIEKIGIPYISNPEDYFFEESLMSNAIYHCSTEGEKVRTELLIDDLRRAKVID